MHMDSVEVHKANSEDPHEIKIYNNTQEDTTTW